MPNDEQVKQLLDDPDAPIAGDNAEDELLRLATKSIAHIAEKHYNAYREDLIDTLSRDDGVSKALLRIAALNAASEMNEEEREEALKKIQGGMSVVRALSVRSIQRELNEIMLSMVMIGMGYMAGDCGAYFSLSRRDQLMDDMVRDAKNFAKTVGGSVGLIEMRMTDGSADRIMKEREEALRKMGIDIDSIV